MDKKYLLQITNELYRLTLLFPKKEPLRYKMRELADDILAQSLRNIYPVRNQKFSNGANQSDSTNKSVNQHPRLINSVLENLETLNGFFEVAKNQNWVAAVEVLRIQEEYNKIKAEIEKIAKRSPEKEIEAVDVRHQQNPPTPGVGINERQEKILAVLKEKEKVQVWQIKQIFPEVSKRTLRRDFENLFKRGIIERRGERNDTFYQLRG
jgi:hypothetical protein